MSNVTQQHVFRSVENKWFIRKFAQKTATCFKLLFCTCHEELWKTTKISLIVTRLDRNWSPVPSRYISIRADHPDAILTSYPFMVHSWIVEFQDVCWNMQSFVVDLGGRSAWDALYDTTLLK
jgi:hypothetical protein